MRYRWLVLAGAVVALAALARASAGARAEGGPLAEEVPPNAVTFSVTPGVPFTYGGVQLRNLGPGAVVLEAVRLDGATAGLQIVSARVLPIAETGGGLWFSHEAFPPPGLSRSLLRPLTGYTLPPDPDGIQVLLQLAAEGAGQFEFRSVSVDYRANGQLFAVTFPFSLRVCAAFRETDATGPGPCLRGNPT